MPQLRFKSLYSNIWAELGDGVRVGRSEWSGDRTRLSELKYVRCIQCFHISCCFETSSVLLIHFVSMIHVLKLFYTKKCNKIQLMYLLCCWAPIRIPFMQCLAININIICILKSYYLNLYKPQSKWAHITMLPYKATCWMMYCSATNLRISLRLVTQFVLQ